MIIAMDLDNIISSPITNPYSLNEVETREVLPGAKEALDKLKTLNHVIVIYSKRDLSLSIHTEVWLRKNKIPYDKIIFGKPPYDLILDSESYKYKTWKDFFKSYKYILE